jgi:hypothetical protein
VKDFYHADVGVSTVRLEWGGGRVSFHVRLVSVDAVPQMGDLGRIVAGCGQRHIRSAARGV